jgi:aldo/keto reductase family protein
MKKIHFSNLKGQYDVVNIGSGPSYYDFNWSGIDEVKGYSFAVSPEDFRYDRRILHNYAKFIKPNGIVIIVVCPLSFAENQYLLSDYYSFKYVGVLPRSEISLSKFKYKAYKNSIGKFIIDNYYRVCAIPQLLKSLFYRKKDKQLSPEERLVVGWLRDNPYLSNLKDLPDCDLTKGFEEKKIELNKIINECINLNLRPVILIPPVSNKLYTFFSKKFLNVFVYDNISDLPEEVMVLDFLHNKKYGGDHLYSNGLFLKHEFASDFTRDVLASLGLKTLCEKKSNVVTKESDRMKNEKYYRLNEDLLVPWIFFGTGIVKKYTRNPYLWFKTNIRLILSSIKYRKLNKELYINTHINKILDDAYIAGFRGFDTARIYGYSESKIGLINEKHSDIWLNTKCSVMDIERAGSPNTVIGNLAISEQNMKTDMMDSLLLHWPEGDKWLDIYKEIVKLYEEKKIRAFGVCNARHEDICLIQQKGIRLPMIIQNEIHPLNTQVEIRKYCKENNILLMAHTPTARMGEEIKNNDVLNGLANKYNKSIAQIIIRWHYQNGIIPIISTTNRLHMMENNNIFDFELSSNEMDSIDSLDRNYFLIKTRGIDDPNYKYNF